MKKNLIRYSIAFGIVVLVSWVGPKNADATRNWKPPCHPKCPPVVIYNGQ